MSELLAGYSSYTGVELIVLERTVAGSVEPNTISFTISPPTSWTITTMSISL